MAKRAVMLRIATATPAIRPRIMSATVATVGVAPQDEMDRGKTAPAATCTTDFECAEPGRRVQKALPLTLAHAPSADLWSPLSPPRRRAVQYGALVISLDFELLWGVRDKRTIADYGANILGVRRVIPALLDLFAERNIACTWATVGLLFFA